MTADELIKQLGKFPPDTRVIIRGYETGYNDIQKLETLNIIPNPGNKWHWEGEYIDDDNGKMAIELWGDNTKATD